MRATVVTALLMLPALARAPLAAEAPPAFPSSIEIVLADVSVVDSAGQPVSGLTASDFTLTVEGRPRHIVSSEFISGAEETVTPPQPEYYSTNEHVRAGQIVILVIDTVNIPPGQGRAAINAAQHLLDRLGPLDQVGLLTTARGGPRVELTTDRALVRKTLERVVGRGAPVDKDTEDEQTLTLPLNTLQATFDVLKGVEGRKTVVLVTPGFASPDYEPGLFRRLGAAAASARCTLFCVYVGLTDSNAAPEMSAIIMPSDLDGTPHAQPSPTTTPEASSPPWLALNDLVQEAGGEVFFGWPEQAFERIAREISGLYLLGFDPEPQDRDGKRHDINVTVARAGVSVRAQRSVHIPLATGPQSADEALSSSLRAPQLATALPLRVATHALAAPAGDVKVLISTELKPGAFSSGLRMAYLLVGAKGKVAASGEQSPKAPAAADWTGPSTTALTVKPGQYTLKVAARDAAGRLGRVDAAVNAMLPRTADPGVEMSDLLLGLPPSAGAPFRPGVSLEISGRSLVAYLEIYGRDQETLKQMRVAMEIAQDETAPALRASEARIVDAPTNGRRVAQTALTFPDLAPGRYLVRAVVSRDGQTLGTVTHPFRLLPPAPK
jgi:VWFA-related protein